MKTPLTPSPDHNIRLTEHAARACGTQEKAQAQRLAKRQYRFAVSLSMLRFKAAVCSLVLVGMFVMGSRSSWAALPSPEGNTKRQIDHWHRTAFDAYEAGKLTRASQFFFKAASAGDFHSRYNLASMRIRNETHRITLTTAKQWLREAAQLGLASAQFSYGHLLEQGLIGPRNLSESNHWFEKAALQGHTEAAFALATAYFLGRGIVLDYAQAARWYEQAAQGGEVNAQYSLASMYLTGLGVKLNLESALEWFTAAARQGDIVAKEQARILIQRLANEPQS
jgi:uncharacterized protein